MEIRIFKTLPQDAAEIRKAVFMEEQGFRDEFDSHEENSVHFVGYIGDKAAGTCRIHYAEEFESFKIGRIAVVREMRGKHLGEEIVKAAEEYLKAEGVKSAVILAQTRAQGFYEKLGYIATDYTCLEENCPHILMKKSF